MKNSYAIIGGSGLYKMEGANIIDEHNIETPFGKTSSLIMEVEINKSCFYFLSRHGEGHQINPSEINYRANVFALKKLGVDHIISISAVGSLHENLEPTHMVLPDQFIDRTKGIRKNTFFIDGVVGHTSMAYPINITLQSKLSAACKSAGAKTHVGGTYVCIEGPQFSTRAESLLYKQWGGSIIGMTNVPEAYLAKEAGISYATIAMVTDFDSWRGEHCTLEEIMKVVNNNREMAHKIVKEIANVMIEEKIEVVKENQNVVVTSLDRITLKQKNILKVILK